MYSRAEGNYPPLKYHYQTLWGNAAPAGLGVDSSTITLGMRVRFGVDGKIIGIRYHRDVDDGANHVGFILSEARNSVPLRMASFRVIPAGTTPPNGAWQNAYFRPHLPVAEDDELVVAVWYEHGMYWRTNFGLSGGPLVSEDLTAPQDGDGGPNGIFGYNWNWDLPNDFGGGLYGIDVIFLANTEVNP
jgi:hypothetical protein